ncbi:MAG TPA: hypothetical protein VF883_12120 [Thermoanaerobaculia bacterium]|jgi:hypothetical protein
MIFYSLCAAFLLSCAFALIGPIKAARGWRRAPARTRIVGAAIVSVLGVAVASVVSMEVTLRSISASTRHPIHGLIGQPTGDLNHVYTPRGKEYKWRSFQRPFAASTVTILAIAIFVTACATKPRLKAATPLWWAAAAGVGSTFAFWMVREFTAWEFFI